MEMHLETGFHKGIIYSGVLKISWILLGGRSIYESYLIFFFRKLNIILSHLIRTSLIRKIAKSLEDPKVHDVAKIQYYKFHAPKYRNLRGPLSEFSVLCLGTVLMNLDISFPSHSQDSSQSLMVGWDLEIVQASSCIVWTRTWMPKGIPCVVRGHTAGLGRRRFALHTGL